MSNPRYEILLGGYKTAPEGSGRVQAVGLPALCTVYTTGFNPKTQKTDFISLGVKYHLYPEFPDAVLIPDYVALLKTQMDRHAADMSEVAIKVGDTPATTGWFLSTPYNNDQRLETNISELITIEQFKGRDEALSVFRKSLEGKGLL